MRIGILVFSINIFPFKSYYRSESSHDGLIFWTVRRMTSPIFAVVFI